MEYEPPSTHPASQTLVKRDHFARFSRKIENLQPLFKIAWRFSELNIYIDLRASLFKRYFRHVSEMFIFNYACNNLMQNIDSFGYIISKILIFWSLHRSPELD